MKIAAILFCLFISVSAFAQQRDTIYTDSLQKRIAFYSALNKKEKPLVVIDGVIYDGNLENVNQDDIAIFAFLVNPGATNIYRIQAKNGAIIINTKKYRDSAAQKNKDQFNESLKHIQFIIDGKLIVDSNIFRQTIQSMNPDDVLEVTVLKDSVSESIHSTRGMPKTILITTKTFAKAEYQKKLSIYSKEYKNYIIEHHNDDKDLLYVVNGVVLDGKQDKITTKLYDLIDKIKTVSFMDKYYNEIFNNNRPIIVITTIK